MRNESLEEGDGGARQILTEKEENLRRQPRIETETEAETATATHIPRRSHIPGGREYRGLSLIHISEPTRPRLI
eukprot:801390-Rhodomonas_salina.2